MEAAIREAKLEINLLEFKNDRPNVGKDEKKSMMIERGQIKMERRGK